VAAVRLLALRLRIAGPVDAQRGGAVDYHSLMRTLAEVRTRLDRLYWPAMLAEAELLYEKDNKPEALEAVNKVVALNPTCAAAWALLGRVTVDSFTFEKTEAIAKQLAHLAAPGFAGGEGGDGDAEPAADSVDGAAILARAMLRQSEGQQALDVLAPALSRFPKHPELRALECAALAVRFDFAAADKRLAEFDADIGPSPLALLRTGAALSEARQYAPAAKYLKLAHERVPADPAPLIDLGLLQIQAGKDDEALAALEEAHRLDPFHVRADNSLRLVRELVGYERIESPHFVVRYRKDPNNPAGGDAILAREMPAIMEKIHQVVAGDGPGGIDYEPQAHGYPKTIVDLMPNHAWFGVRIAGMPQIHTIAASTGPIIAMESPRDGPGQSGPYDWERVVRHEYVHTVTLARTANRIPHWFTEASAVNLELAPRDFQTCTLLAGALKGGKLFDFNEINIAFIRPKEPTDRQQAYAQGHWMYEYILKTHGNRAPLELMDKYAAGVREEEAFQQVLGITRAELMSRFKLWAFEQVRSWGMAVADDVPTLRQLLASEALADSSTPEERKPGLRLIEAGAMRYKPGQTEQSATVKLADGTELELSEVALPEPTAAMIAKWLAEHPTHPDVLELAVDEMVKRVGGNVTPAEAPLLERYAAARPVDPKPHRLLARMYLGLSGAEAAALDAEDARKAIPHLEFLDQREQRTPLYAIELAKRYAAVGDFDRAREKAERATRVSPFDAAAREVAATIALQAKDLDGAERQLTALSQLEPDRDLHTRRIEALRKMRGK
ncbi:MAG: tetratricopeptide repeat protein, partial [Phycisphaerales bacterium]|nr:tetratricopeptide repeat protein [Phycisphaerales bacterium]